MHLDLCHFWIVDNLGTRVLNFHHPYIDRYGGNRFDTSPAPPPPYSISPSSPRSPGHNSSSGKSSHDERKSKYLTSGRIVGIVVARLLTVIAVVLIIMFFIIHMNINTGLEARALDEV